MEPGMPTPTGKDANPAALMMPPAKDAMAVTVET
jgi:hypothetical protein